MLRIFLAFLFVLSPTPPESLIFSPLASEDEVSSEIARPEVGAPWVRAVAGIDAPPETVCTLLSRFSDYANVFADNIDSVQVLNTEGTSQRLHIVWGLPFPFRDRDAVVKYSIEKNESGCVVRWCDAAQPGDPAPNGIRIQHVEGSTVVAASSTGLSKITYFYYAELGGDLYSWAKESAYRAEPLAYVEAIRKAMKQPSLLSLP